MTAHTYGHKWISVPSCHIYYPICVKVGVRDLKKMLLSVLWISWKLAQGRPYFSYGREWNCLYARSVQPYDIMKVKYSLGKLRVLGHGPQRDVHIHSNATRLPSGQPPNHYSTLPSVCILYWPLSSFVALRRNAYEISFDVLEGMTPYWITYT